MLTIKESNSTANESKRQYNRSIIYYLNIAPIVNDSFWISSKKKKRKVSKLDAIPLRHEAETFDLAQISL